jgi:hypothetical protein
MTATLVWNGPPTTPAQQDRPVEAVEYAKALALISAVPQRKCASPPLLTRPAV